MYRIDDETSASSMPPMEEASAEGFFTEGDPATGIPATVVRASWLNMVQEELRTIVEAGGLTPSKDAHGQVLEALIAKFARRITTASGEADQIIGIFNPVVSTLTNGLSVQVRASLENTSKSPIFQADETGYKEIVKGNDLPLEEGDISGAGHWLELHYDEELDKWVLQNPAKGINQSRGLPVGGIAYFAMKEPPVGYLNANGAAVSREAYPGLFAAIGTVFGAGDGETTFNLPDLRGEFVRGWDEGRNADAGRVFGSWQKGTAATFDKEKDSADLTGLVNAVNNDRATMLKAVGADDVNQSDYVGAQGFYISGSFAGLNSNMVSATRPRNIALLACIKAFDVAENPGLVDITALANQMSDRVPYADFMGVNQSKTRSGWQKLPGGLIIQWGYVYVDTNVRTELFPIAFPNLSLSIAMIQNNPGNFGVSVGLNNSATFITHAISSNVYCHYIAIGY